MKKVNVQCARPSTTNLRRCAQRSATRPLTIWRGLPRKVYIIQESPPPPPPLARAEECDKIPDDMEGLAASFDRLQQSLAQAKEYVDAVVVSLGGVLLFKSEKSVFWALARGLQDMWTPWWGA